MPANIGLADDAYAQLRNEFGDWMNGELDTLESCINDASQPEAQESTDMTLLRIAHNIKGSGGAFGFTTITTVAHRFEDFISATLIDLSCESYRSSLLRFVDQMRALTELGKDPKPEIAQSMLRSLPVAGEYTNNSISPKTDLPLKKPDSFKEALIISPSKTISAISRTVFESLGHRVVGTRSGLEGLQLAINMHPDFIIMSTIIGEISGPDLTRALSSMRSTSNIKLILISNLDKGHSDLKDIPDTVDIIHQAGNFPMVLFKHIQSIS